jgi:hypothetical protein
LSASWALLVVSLWFVVVVLAVLVLGLIRRVGPMLTEARSPHDAREPQGLPLGAVVPFFQARDIVGRIMGRDDLIATGGLFLFLSPGCPPCDALLRDFKRSFEPMASQLYLILDRASAPESWIDVPGERVLYEIDHSMTKAFRNTAAPHAFAVTRDGRVVERGVVNTTRELQEMAQRLTSANEVRTTHVADSVEGPALVRGGV